ncbi:MAG TPA: anthranilate phosphoribosyltransferase [Thermoplasmata archaeon]|nr:anthranilate phosphoribosyltransferase [Thermoplasmata archaeon]
MIGSLLERAADGRPLRPVEVRSAVDLLVRDSTSDVERAALLAALATRGETSAEIAAFARELQRRSIPFPGPRANRAIDLCGSGGARRPAFNVGTVSSFVVRAAGVPVAKHGNRSLRGARLGYAGSSDLIEALGLPYLTSRAFARESYRREGITFLHAPLFHPAIDAVGPVRRALGIRTLFNQLGPLTNPARVSYQVVGTPDRATARSVASILPRLGVHDGATIVASDATDEFSPTRPSELFLWSGTRRHRLRVDPHRYLDPDDRRGSNGPLPARESAAETERILAGGGGARRGSILLTSALGLWVRGAAPTLRAGVARATDALDSGNAEALLGRLRELGASRIWAGEE